jgi:hypothetical protein
MECPGGSWKKVETGHFLRRALREDTVIKDFVKSVLGGNRGVSVRRLFTAGMGGEWGRYPNHALLLADLGADWGPEVPADVEGSELPRLWGWLLRGRALVCPSGTGKGRRVGWLVSAPDEVTAAAWEAALMVAYNLWEVKASRCLLCGEVYVGRKSVCSDCKSKRPSKPPTERRRFLNLLAKWVERGKITPEQRDDLKTILQKRGLVAAKKAREEILRQGGKSDQT